MELYEVCSLHLRHHIVALRRSTLLRMPGSREHGGRRKEEEEVCQELEAAGNSVEGTYTGHVYLPVHPAAVLSPQLCLEAAPVLTGTDYSDSPCYTESWGPGV